MINQQIITTFKAFFHVKNVLFGVLMGLIIMLFLVLFGKFMGFIKFGRETFCDCKNAEQYSNTNIKSLF